MAWWAPWRKKAFSPVPLLDKLMADTRPEPPSQRGVKLITCKACNHQWTTKRHRLGLPIKCPECHTVWTAEGEVCCENCGRVHSVKLTNCPKCRHARN
jgi:Zn-finger nucleic acid-binding protein